MRSFVYLLILMSVMLMTGCYTLREPIIKKNELLQSYRYILLPNTANLKSGSGALYGGAYGTYGAMSSKEINPGSIIEGILMKKGYISLDSLREEFLDETLIIKYGESGTRDVGLGGYTIEVTIYFYSARTYEEMNSCTAEGIGTTEADDIRKAITRCLSGV